MQFHLITSTLKDPIQTENASQSPERGADGNVQNDNLLLGQTTNSSQQGQGSAFDIPEKESYNATEEIETDTKEHILSPNPLPYHQPAENEEQATPIRARLTFTDDGKLDPDAGLHYFLPG